MTSVARAFPPSQSGAGADDREPLDQRPRTCATCAHRAGSVRWGTCALSGYYVTTERQIPTKCGRDFAGWVQREPLVRRLKAWLWHD